MSNLTEIKQGRRIWKRDILCNVSLPSEQHSLIVHGLKEALKEDPINLGSHLVFELGPVIIELYKENQKIRLLSEIYAVKELDYNQWFDLFDFVRDYWKKVVSYNNTL